MRTLVLDSALARRTAAVVADEVVVALRTELGRQGSPRNRSDKEGQDSGLPLMARDVMEQVAVARSDSIPAGAPDAALDLVAVTVGPGSFTGIRSGLALAHGIGLARNLPVVGVTVGEAMAIAFPHLGDRALWIATESRRGHIFLERESGVISLAIEDLPSPSGAVAVAGSAAIQVASRLAAGGANVMLTDARFPQARHIALAAERRHAGTLPPRAAQPLYVDPPEARLPQAGGLRPPPQSTVHQTVMAGQFGGSIAVATREHAAAMAEIHRTAFPSKEAWSRDVMILQLDQPATFGFVHQAGGMILARAAAGEAEILTLAVDPERRRHGLGSALLRAAMAHAASLEATSMVLEVAVTNTAARGLYDAHGFVEAGMRRNYYSDGTDALILRSTLSSPISDS